MTKSQEARLHQLIDQIRCNPTIYPKKAIDWESVEMWLRNDDVAMAIFTAEKMITTMNNLAAGIPPQLQTLLDQIYSDLTTYPNKTADCASMQSWLDNGEYAMAIYEANLILQAMKNVQLDIPAELQSRLDRIKSDTTSYPKKSKDWGSLQTWLNNGNFYRALYQAKAMIKTMDNLEAGIPPQLQTLLTQIQNAKVSYPKKSADCDALRTWLENGDYDMASYQAKEILLTIKNVQREMPTELKILLEQVRHNSTPYPKKTADWESVQTWLNNGNFTMALYKARIMVTAMKYLT
ncbi:hypothetical protein [Edaphovirga cremea]|uniref:hypothetical protein n=1 Tax=Edaphovirga cremea TaxID=2267246 RepID=UPI003988A90A